MANPIHIDMADLERSIRATVDQPIPAKYAKDPVIACQHRGRELHVQFALWFMGEINAATDADYLIQACGQIVGNMLQNVDSMVETDGGAGSAARNVLQHAAEFLDRIGDDTRGAVSRTASFKATSGGNA